MTEWIIGVVIFFGADVLLFLALIPLYKLWKNRKKK